MPTSASSASRPRSRCASSPRTAGISNPYLSQIERGLRRPSADILQQIAKGLRISAEALYVQAGFLEDRPPGSMVREAVLTDPELTERQRQMLIEIYESFRKETALASGKTDVDDSGELVAADEAALSWPEDVGPEALEGLRGPRGPGRRPGRARRAGRRFPRFTRQRVA